MGAFLALVPSWVYKALGVVAVLGLAWLSGLLHEKRIVETRVVKQEVQVEHTIVQVDHSHDQELADLRAYRAAHPIDAVSLCVSNDLPATASQGPTSPSAGGIQQVPTGDRSSGSAQAGPDIGGMLDLLAAKADEVSAGLRARQEIEP